MCVRERGVVQSKEGGIEWEWGKGRKEWGDRNGKYEEEGEAERGVVDDTFSPPPPSLPPPPITDPSHSFHSATGFYEQGIPVFDTDLPAPETSRGRLGLVDYNILGFSLALCSIVLFPGAKILGRGLGFSAGAGSRQL